MARSKEPLPEDAAAVAAGATRYIINKTPLIIATVRHHVTHSLVSNEGFEVLDVFDEDLKS